MGKKERVGLPAGRFRGVSETVARALGMVATGDRDISVGHEFDCLFLKARDLIPLLNVGVISVALVPDEWLAEARFGGETANLRSHSKAVWLHSSLAWLFSGTGSTTAGPTFDDATVVTAFPRVADGALREAGVSGCSLLSVQGSVEAITVAVGGIGFDVVETGATADSHGLRFQIVGDPLRVVVVSSAAASADLVRRAETAAQVGEK